MNKYLINSHQIQGNTSNGSNFVVIENRRSIYLREHILVNLSLVLVTVFVLVESPSIRQIKF